jgi:serine/threonine-protein kinase
VRLVPGEDFGRYRIEAELGRGGQAVVYRATQIDLERPVALKVFDEGYLARPGALERFRREAIGAGRLAHPHIVTVYDAGEVGGRAFISMRLIPGDTLAARIARSGALPPAEALDVLDDIAGAIDFAHDNGTVHRDVTPGNILLEPGEGAFLGDFGLVRMDDMPGLTRRGDWLGTAEYVSPEQVEGDPAGPASDRYALAAVAFEALTGRPPYVHREPSAVLLAHVRDTVPRASAVNRALPPAVDEVLAAGLAKNPGDRPAHGRDLVARLREVLVDGAPAAVPRSAAEGTEDPWSHALARFATGGGAPPAAPTPERATEAFGGRSPRRPFALSRDVAVALGVGVALLIAAGLVGGWMLGTSNADTAPAERRAYAEGRAAGLDTGFARGRAQGVKEGRTAGRKQGLKEGRAAGREAGLKEGREAGYAEGLDDGYANGVSEGRGTALSGLSAGGWYVVWVGSDSYGPQIGSSTPVSPDSGECYTVSGGTVFSGVCNGAGE